MLMSDPGPRPIIHPVPREPVPQLIHTGLRIHQGAMALDSAALQVVIRAKQTDGVEPECHLVVLFRLDIVLNSSEVIGI
jgi:hypothetical protein